MKTPIFIPIDRKSIKPNPYYCPPGGTKKIRGRQWCELIYIGEIPNKLKPHLRVLGIIVTNNVEYRCQCIGDISLFVDNPNVKSLDIKCEPIDVSTRDSKKYLYKHRDVLLKCSECSSKIVHKYIGIGFDENDNPYDVCPACEGENTFPKYELEIIEDVI